MIVVWFYCCQLRICGVLCKYYVKEGKGFGCEHKVDESATALIINQCCGNMDSRNIRGKGIGFAWKEQPMSTGADKYRGTQTYSLVYCKLLNAARKKESVAYEEIAKIMGLEAHAGMAQKIGQLLGEINAEEHNNGRPMLSAVAVKPETRMPGEGFFQFAKELRKFDGETDEDKREFWRDEIQRVYEMW